MAMAASLSVIVWRMLRDERRRSDARVVALTTKAGTRDLILRESPVRHAALFAKRDVSSPWGRRFAVMAGLGLVVASVILFALTATGKAAATRQAGRTAVTAAAATDKHRQTQTNAQAGTNPGVAGLELLSLRDARQPGSLTITGLVQNPRGGAPHSRVTVTAYAFDDKGAFLASGRALVDVTTLAPGDESPFVVSVPVTETVARYRIGFRSEDGRVIAHIDKRQQAAVAALVIQ
jgi:hypothetical protein